MSFKALLSHHTCALKPPDIVVPELQGKFLQIEIVPQGSAFQVRSDVGVSCRRGRGSSESAERGVCQGWPMNCETQVLISHVPLSLSQGVMYVPRLGY